MSRSAHYALPDGGILYINATLDPLYSSGFHGTRLAFRGKIEVIDDVDTYKSLKAIY